MNVNDSIDELLKAFQSSSVPTDGDSSVATSSDAVRWCQFKSHQGPASREDGQAQRRERVLREQSKLREAKLAERRHLKTATKPNVAEAKVDDQSMLNDSTTSASSSTSSPNQVRKNRSQNRQLRYGDDPDLLKPMLSEWMFSVPEDLSTDWLMLFCPIGRRNMVVAHGGSTIVYSKAGKQVMHFTSSLPSSGDSSTILDCIFSQTDLTFYVLDLLVWNGTNLVETDTECRQYFLRSRFAENPKISQNGVHNSGYRFVLASILEDCSPSNVAKIVSEQPQTPPIDGLLFYHRRCFYTHGVTPTVLWLRPFMLPTTLGVENCDIAMK